MVFTEAVRAGASRASSPDGKLAPARAAFRDCAGPAIFETIGDLHEPRHARSRPVAPLPDRVEALRPPPSGLSRSADPAPGREDGARRYERRRGCWLRHRHLHPPSPGYRRDGVCGGADDSMRAAAEAQFRTRENFRSVKGTAEATGLGERAISLVTCAQAFHWFEPAGARREFGRILVWGGWCALIWNTRFVEESGFSADYERITEEFGTTRGASATRTSPGPSDLTISSAPGTGRVGNSTISRFWTSGA